MKLVKTSKNEGSRSAPENRPSSAMFRKTLLVTQCVFFMGTMGTMGTWGVSRHGGVSSPSRPEAGPDFKIEGFWPPQAAEM